MPVEESVTTGGNTSLTRNFLGARGIEAMFVTENGVTVTSYPLYDVHGNMVATVQKGSSGTSWTIHDERSYDVWGSVRSGASSGGPRGRYCANLGHVQDDESWLVYMRARYYEPESGRFISEDPARETGNWYAYGANSPTNKVDVSGKSPAHLIAFLIGALISAVQTWVIESSKPGITASKLFLKVLAAGAIGGLSGLATASAVIMNPGAAQGAAAASAAIGSFLQSIVGDLIDSGGDMGSVNWKKAALAAGIGGTVGFAFGAIGASWGRNLQCADALNTEAVGSALGEWTGNAVGAAIGNYVFP